MSKRGRKSSAELSIRVDGSPDQLDPPDHLGPDERQRFIELVGATDTKHFRPTDLPLLARYCEADCLAERAARELRDGGPVISGKPSPWLIVQEKAVRAIVALSMRLRLSPQSRTDPKTVGRQSPASAHKLWDRRPPWE